MGRAALSFVSAMCVSVALRIVEIRQNGGLVGNSQVLASFRESKDANGSKSAEEKRAFWEREKSGFARGMRRRGESRSGMGIVRK